MHLRRPTIVGCLVVALGCAPHGPAVEPGSGSAPGTETAGAPTTAEDRDAGAEPVVPPEHPAADPGLLCLPLATCGCFQEEECVAVRLRADGITVDIVEGPRAGQTGHLLQHCLGDAAAPTDCVDYVDPAIVCRRPSSSTVASAKYVCATDDLRPDFECGFDDGACTVR
ncbi:MAG: hypothetical protein JXB32_20885 [Deltaproteobacteria bacterium]|nr:hypothetical protein [Deltaproteobacteria bacterium]